MKCACISASTGKRCQRTITRGKYCSQHHGCRSKTPHRKSPHRKSPHRKSPHRLRYNVVPALRLADLRRVKPVRTNGEDFSKVNRAFRIKLAERSTKKAKTVARQKIPSRGGSRKRRVNVGVEGQTRREVKNITKIGRRKHPPPHRGSRQVKSNHPRFKQAALPHIKNYDDMARTSWILHH